MSCKDDIDDEVHCHDVIIDRIAVQFSDNPRVQICSLIEDVFKENRTIPFIERYRKAKVSEIKPVEMRAIVDTYSEMIEVNKSAQRFLKKYRNSLVGSEQKHIECCVVKEEFDQMKAAVKERADKKISKSASDSISQIVDDVLHNRIPPENVLGYVPSEAFGEFGNAKEVLQAVKTSLISKLLVSCETLVEDIKKSLMSDHSVRMHVEEVKKLKQSEKCGDKKSSADTFQPYFNFTRSIGQLLAHQVMAINRGENLKYLKVQVVFPSKFFSSFRSFIQSTFGRVFKSAADASFAHDCLVECYNRVEKKLSRFVRGTLKMNAVKESVEVLQKNLKQNLLVEPMKNVRIMGIDPGFKNGCKIAIIDESDCIRATGVLNLTAGNESVLQSNKVKLRQYIDSHAIEIIALGDGCGSVEADQLLTEMLAEMPQTSKVKFSTVTEAGVSVWSVSEDATAEFPDLQPNIRSAVGLARRLRDPLSELSRVPPRHLSVGQYQHDIPEHKLNTAMNDTMQEVVSFAGIDLNTVGSHVLNHVAGVGPKLALKIVKCRDTLHGRRFMSREHLRRAVSGLGPKTFEQCAGFVKVFPPKANSYQVDEGQPESCAPPAKKRKTATKSTKDVCSDWLKPNALDVTIIHPNMYPIATEILRSLGFDHISADDFMSGSLSERIKQTPGLQEKAAKLKCDVCENEDKKQDFDFVLNCLLTNSKTELNIKERIDFIDVAAAKKLKGNCRVGVTLSSIYMGRVVNVTGFGAFIDLVNVSDEKGRVKGLAPISLNGGAEIQGLQCGQRVNVKVVKIESDKGRYTLRIM